jgi:hypothetical protein
VILRTGKTSAGREVRTVIKHISRRIKRHWPATRITCSTRSTAPADRPRT